MLLIPFINEWNEKMSAIGALVALYEKRDLRLEQQVNQFLLELEALADKQHIQLGADIALIRGKMLKAGRLPGAKEETASARRKLRENEILDALTLAKQAVDQFLQADRAGLEEASGMLRQAIAVTLTKEHLKPGGQELELSAMNSNSAETILQIMRQDSDLIPVVTMAAGKVGLTNLRILVDQLLPEVL